MISSPDSGVKKDLNIPLLIKATYLKNLPVLIKKSFFFKSLVVVSSSICSISSGVKRLNVFKNSLIIFCSVNGGEIKLNSIGNEAYKAYFH